MNKTLLLIGAIGVSILILANTLPTAESHSSKGSGIKAHLTVTPVLHIDGGSMHDIGCQNPGGHFGFLHFHDHDGDGIHDHDGTEDLDCKIGSPPP